MFRKLKSWGQKSSSERTCVFFSPQPAVMSGSIPKCSTCGGVVKPDIVFFGEELPPHFLKYLTDFPLADLLIIMGTSLEVRHQDSPLKVI